MLTVEDEGRGTLSFFRAHVGLRFGVRTSVVDGADPRQKWASLLDLDRRLDHGPESWCVLI